MVMIEDIMPRFIVHVFILGIFLRLVFDAMAGRYLLSLAFIWYFVIGGNLFFKKLTYYMLVRFETKHNKK